MQPSYLILVVGNFRCHCLATRDWSRWAHWRLGSWGLLVLGSLKPLRPGLPFVLLILLFPLPLRGVKMAVLSSMLFHVEEPRHVTATWSSALPHYPPLRGTDAWLHMIPLRLAHDTSVSCISDGEGRRPKGMLTWMNQRPYNPPPLQSCYSIA